MPLSNCFGVGALNPFGVPGKIWDLVLVRDIRLAYDDRVLIEYERVLKRSKFSFEKSYVGSVLATFLFQESVSAKAWPHQRLPDLSTTLRPCAGGASV